MTNERPRCPSCGEYMMIDYSQIGQWVCRCGHKHREDINDPSTWLETED